MAPYLIAYYQFSLNIENAFMQTSVTLLGIDLGASQISAFLLQNGVKKKLSFGYQNFISSTLGFYNDKFIIGNDVQTVTPSSKLTVISNWKPCIGSSVVNSNNNSNNNN